MLRGKRKVTIETGLLALAQNLRKKLPESLKNRQKKTFLNKYALSLALRY
jgi:hypothetical protein